MKMYISKFKTLLFLLGFISTTAAIGQSSLAIEASQLRSTFKFQDSEGNVDDSYLPAYTGAYSIGYRHASESGLLLRANIGKRNAGATMTYDDANYLWSLQYADVKMGAGYLYKMGRFHPYLTVSGYYAYLLKANQIQGSTNYDMIKGKELQRTDYGVVTSPGVQITLSDYISIYTEISYLTGLKNMEIGNQENNADKQKGHNRAYSATLGVAFTITK